MPMPEIPLEPKDALVLQGLREGPGQERTARYEWKLLQMLLPIERLMQNLADGPALPLSWKDEFRRGERASQGKYIIAPHGRLQQLILSLGHLSEVTKALPASHLSPWLQAMYRVFLYEPGSSPPSRELDASVLSAFRESQAGDTRRPDHSFDFRMASERAAFPFSEEEARRFSSSMNPYYRCLANVLKDSNVKRSQRYRINRAISHHNRLAELFRGIASHHNAVLLIYLELKGPTNTNDPLEKMEEEDPEGYRKLSEARASFLEGRQHQHLFHGLIGYAWKYRFSHGQGLVCMMVLFYDNNRESQAGQLTDALGERWLSVSPEGSRYWSPLSNTPGPLSDHHHYGFLPTHEPDVQNFLGSLARLMGLYDAYIKPVAPKGLHVYDSSQPPKPIKKKKKQRQTAARRKMSEIRPAPIVEANKRRKDIDR